MKFRKITSWDTIPVVINVETACCLLNVCDRTIYNMLKSKKIKGKRDGKQWFILRDSIREFVES